MKREEGKEKKARLGFLSISFFILLFSFFAFSCPSAPVGNGGDDNNDGGNGGGGGSGEFSPNTQRLFNYLVDNYGKNIISGQMDTAWTENGTSDMISRVYADTGKYPALKGFDFIDLPHSWSGYGRNQVTEAIEWWEGKNRVNSNSASSLTKLLPDKPDIHGIVAFCWHWRTGSGNKFYKNETTFRIPMKSGKLDKESAAFATIKSDLDKVAALLQQLKDEDIPVLWRPLHEAAGNWPPANPASAFFWWGDSGSAACIALWEYMHDYFTNEKELNNLIWVWNAQSPSWFPNPATVNIISYDYYTNSNTQTTAQNYKDSNFTARFTDTKNTPPEKNLMVALSENGAIPDPDWSYTNDAMWSWFMVWNDSSGTASHKDNFWSGGYHNTSAHKTKVYNHEKVITLDELPDLTKYRLE